jgi:hypothetical protein
MASTRHRKTRVIVIAIAVWVAEVVAMRARGYRMGRNVVVRCQRGHLFTTIWLPAASLKSIRLVWWRVQRCPVGHHWSVVTPVREADLSARDRRIAGRTRDVPVP